MFEETSSTNFKLSYSENQIKLNKRTSLQQNDAGFTVQPQTSIQEFSLPSPPALSQRLRFVSAEPWLVIKPARLRPRYNLPRFRINFAPSDFHREMLISSARTHYTDFSRRLRHAWKMTADLKERDRDINNIFGRRARVCPNEFPLKAHA